MKIDVILDARASAQELCELGLLAEQNGIDGVWVSSLLDARDPFANFSLLANESSTIRMGPIAVNPWDIHPVRIAASLYTLNEFSNGRARIVIGGGGEALQALNLEPRRRVRAVKECVEILKLAADGERRDYFGELYQVKGHQLSWLTAERPQVYVGANMEQMLRMSARVADGIMMSDMPPKFAKAALEQVAGDLHEQGRSADDFWNGSFTAWHVYESFEEARREACQWMLLRGLFRPWVLGAFLDEAEVNLIMNSQHAFMNAFVQKTHEVEGVPRSLLDKLVENLTLTSSIDKLDNMIVHLDTFKQLGMKSITLRLYNNPAESIRLIGERIVPQVAD